MTAWGSSLGYGGVSESTNSKCGAVLVVMYQIRLARSSTVSLAQKNYWALSTYPIVRYRWNLMRVSSSSGYGGETKASCGRSSGHIHTLM